MDEDESVLSWDNTEVFKWIHSMEFGLIIFAVNVLFHSQTQ